MRRLLFSLLPLLLTVQPARADEPRDAGPNSAQPSSAQPDNADPDSAQPNNAAPNNTQPNSADAQSVEPSHVEPSRVEPSRAELLRRGHHKKVVGASLMIAGSLLDAVTTALTFTGLSRGGWSLTPKSSTDSALLWTGVGGGFVLDSILTAGIVIYCDGGQLMRKAATR